MPPIDEPIEEEILLSLLENQRHPSLALLVLLHQGLESIPGPIHTKTIDKTEPHRRIIVILKTEDMLKNWLNSATLLF